MTDYSIRDFGAVGDGKTNDAAAIQAAIDRCHAGGGGRVVAPAGGNYRTGTFTLKSNVEFHVERGAAVLGSGDASDYQTVQVSDSRRRSIGYPDVPDSIALITAYGAENIAITGGGVIDGGGKHFIATELPYIYRMKPQRPFTFFFIGCNNVTFRDIVIRDGALWTVRLSGCDDVLIHAIHIQNDLKLPNNDGIDLDHCRNVRISDCHIVCGDDCIVLKTCKDAGDFGPCENITVTGCTLVSTSSALIIGCEAHAPMRNVVFDSCVVQSSHRGLAIRLSHESDVENVIFSNMVVETRIFHEDWWGRGEPICISAHPWTAQDQIGHVRHVRFSNILCRGESGVFIQGWAPDRVEDIVLENVRVEVDKWSKWPGGRHDLRPWPSQDSLPEHPTAGFFIKNAHHVTLRDCEVAWGATRPDYFRHALESHHVDGLRLQQFRGQAAHPDKYDALLLVDTRLEPGG